MGTVDMAGIQKRVSLILLEDAQVGDYVIVHAGFGIHKIDEEAARESLRILREAAYLLDIEDAGEPEKVTITRFGTEEADS